MPTDADSLSQDFGDISAAVTALEKERDELRRTIHDHVLAVVDRDAHPAMRLAHEAMVKRWGRRVSVSHPFENPRGTQGELTLRLDLTPEFGGAPRFWNLTLSYEATDSRKFIGIRGNGERVIDLSFLLDAKKPNVEIVVDVIKREWQAYLLHYAELPLPDGLFDLRN